MLSTNGLSAIEKGGNVKVIESSNPDMKTLMEKGDIDAALIPEPWVTRLINRMGVKVLLGNDEVWNTDNYSTTIIHHKHKVFG